MPQAIPAVAKAVALYFAEAGTTTYAVVYGVTYVVASVAISTAISYGLNSLTAKKPTSSTLPSQALDNTTTIKSATASRQLIYGRVRTGGVLVFAATSGTDNKYLNLVIALAGHEVEEIGDIYFGGDVVPLSGNDATGDYAGYASIYKHLGSTTQTVDTDLQTAVGSATWTDNHRLQGIAYIYVKLTFSQDKFPGGIPDVSAVVKGRKVLDTRDSSTAYSTNWALCVRDYLTLSGLGLGADSVEIDTAECNAAANTSDEDVVLADASTEKRYAVNGVVNLDETPGDILAKLASAGAGMILFVGGKWIIRAGAYQTPSITLDESDFRGPISVQTKLSRREIYNGVKGLYVSEDQQWQPADFPPITNATYTAEDGGERIWNDVEFYFTISNPAAQRLAKIQLERCRQQITVNAAMKLTAMQCQVGDVIMLNNTRMGWDAKPFEVVSFSFAVDDSDGGKALGIDLVLRETAAGVWDWNDGEETTVDLAPNTNLYDPRAVAAPGSFTALSDATTAYLQDDGSVISRVKLTWDASADAQVTSGGHVVVQYRLNGSGTWLDYDILNGDAVITYIPNLQIGAVFDFRVAYRNARNVTGAFSAITSHTVGGDTAAPAAPTGLTATSGAGFISLDWDDNTESDLGEYGVYRNTSNSFSGSTKIAEVRASRLIDAEGLTTGTTYYYFITAIDRSENESSASTSASAAPTAPISGSTPSTPSAPTYNSGGTYDSGDGNVFAYLIINTPSLPAGAIALDVLYRVNGSASWVLADQVNASGTARIDDLSPGVDYQFAVRGISNGGALSSVSTVLSYTAPNKSGAPATPSGVSATATLESITIDWNDNTEADLSIYEVWRNTTNNSGTATKVAEVRVSRFVDTLVSTTSTYYYWIKAVNRTGNASGFSSVVYGNPNSQTGGSGTTFTLTLTSDMTNPINAPTGAGTYASGTVVAISAPTPAVEFSNTYNFTSWSGSWPDTTFVENTSSASTNVVMNADVTLHANYV